MGLTLTDYYAKDSEAKLIRLVFKSRDRCRD